MSPPSKINESSESPTQSGVYWFHSETMSRALMVDVRMTNGQLMVWWPNQDEPVANLAAGAARYPHQLGQEAGRLSDGISLV